VAQYYWSKYNAIPSTTTTYSNQRLTASGSSSGSGSGYVSYYNFSPTTGFTEGPGTTPSVGDTVYFVQSRTVVIEYYIKSKVGSTYNYDYYRYECDSSTNTTYSKGALISTFVADGAAYASGGVNADGYWYERGELYSEPGQPPSAPVLEIAIQSFMDPQHEVFLDWTDVSANYYAVENLSTGQTHTLITGTDHIWTGLNPGTTYQFRVSAHNQYGWSEYSNTKTIATALPALQRPTNWEWYTAKIAGIPFELTALEWTNFCAKINEFRNYRNYSNYPFSPVSSEEDFLASVFNEATNAISIMTPPTSVPLSKVKEDDVLASDINQLRNALNSVT
jgi:hypothetical protein